MAVIYLLLLCRILVCKEFIWCYREKPAWCYLKSNVVLLRTLRIRPSDANVLVLVRRTSSLITPSIEQEGVAIQLVGIGGQY